MAVLSISELTTFRWTFDEDVRQLAAAEIPAIGVWRQKLADFGEEKGIELLREYGLQVSSLHWAGGFTGSEGRSHLESISDARDAIQLAAELGSENLTIYSGSRAGHTHKHARRLLKNALDALLPIAEEHNVRLALEPMHSGCASEWTFLTTLEETLQLAQECGSGHLQIAFDTYQLGHDAENWEHLEDFVEKISVVHLGDARSVPHGEQSRYPLGQGTLPLQEIVSGLLKYGYHGFFEVELMGEEIETCDYHELLVSSKRAFAELLESARETQ